MPKTTFNAVTKRWELFLKEVPVRRDTSINLYLPGELKRLAAIPACDEAGFQWLKKTWMGKDGMLRDDLTTHVAVMLDKDVLDRLNATCEEKRVPRDAFFHYFLEYLTTRLFQPAKVFLNPRRTDDVLAQIADVLMDDDISDEWERDRFLVEIAREAFNSRQLGILSPGYYQNVLSYDKARVEAEIQMIESL